MMSRAEVLDAAPFVPSAGLTGGALWYDARMLDPKAIVEVVVRRVLRAGATALAGVEVDGLTVERSRCTGVHAHDRRSGERLTFGAPLVVNAAGPWAPSLLQRFRASPKIDLEFAIAWNLLVDRPMQQAWAVALTAPEPRAQTFFAYSSESGMLLGTGHAAWSGDLAKLEPGEAELERFLGAVNRAAPALALTRHDIRRTLAGLLPTTVPGSAELTQRPAIVDHGARGGVTGLYTVVGIKYTTARATARKLIATMGLEARRA
jgi:glycerol-3-phosphate dehydrogenase